MFCYASFSLTTLTAKHRMTFPIKSNMTVESALAPFPNSSNVRVLSHPVHTSETFFSTSVKSVQNTTTNRHFRRDGKTARHQAGCSVNFFWYNCLDRGPRLEPGSIFLPSRSFKHRFAMSFVISDGSTWLRLGRPRKDAVCFTSASHTVCGRLLLTRRLQKQGKQTCHNWRLMISFFFGKPKQKKAACLWPQQTGLCLMIHTQRLGGVNVTWFSNKNHLLCFKLKNKKDKKCWFDGGIWNCHDCIDHRPHTCLRQKSKARSRSLWGNVMFFFFSWTLNQFVWIW